MDSQVLQMAVNSKKKNAYIQQQTQLLQNHKENENVT